MKKVKSKIIKNKCEIEDCDVKDPNLLQLHHIIHRTEVNTTNHEYNLALLCSNCHILNHSGRIQIIGIYPSSKQPNNRTLVYIKDGIKNIEGIDTPYVDFKNKSYKIFNKESKDEE